MSTCNNFIIFSLQQSLSSISDNVEIGGHCPLTAAFILSQGGLGNGTSKTALNTSLIPNQKNDMLWISSHVLIWMLCFLKHVKFYKLILFVDLECKLGDFYVRPRIILISVGRPTDFSIIDVDLCPQMETDEVSTLSVDFNTILIINVHFKINTISNFIVL